MGTCIKNDPIAFLVRVFTLGQGSRIFNLERDLIPFLPVPFTSVRVYPVLDAQIFVVMEISNVVGDQGNV